MAPAEFWGCGRDETFRSSGVRHEKHPDALAAHDGISAFVGWACSTKQISWEMLLGYLGDCRRASLY